MCALFVMALLMFVVGAIAVVIDLFWQLSISVCKHVHTSQVACLCKKLELLLLTAGQNVEHNQRIYIPFFVTAFANRDIAYLLKWVCNIHGEQAVMYTVVCNNISRVRNFSKSNFLCHSSQPPLQLGIHFAIPTIHSHRHLQLIFLQTKVQSRNSFCDSCQPPLIVWNSFSHSKNSLTPPSCSSRIQWSNKNFQKSFRPLLPLKWYFIWKRKM